MKFFTSGLLLMLVLIGCALQTADEPENVRHLADKVARWQLAHMDDFQYVRTFVEHTKEPRGWVQAAFYIGLNRWQETTNNPELERALIAKAEGNNWQLGPLPWHADDQAFAQVYLALAEDRKRANIAPTRRAFDDIIGFDAQNSLEFIRDRSGRSEGTCQRRWCWSDALFMAPPAWAALSRLTGDESYLEYALKEYWATTDYLFDSQDHLYYRDSRFFQRESEHGNKVFWSRGNGWVFAGLPLLIEQLPQDHPDRPRLIAHFRKMAHAFKNIQADNGLWASSLMDYQHDPLPETSGSSFILFGLAWGVNRDILPPESFTPTINKGWRAVTDRVDDRGKLGWVQQVGYAPDQVLASDTQLYGSGAFLLAASEMLAFY